MVPGHLPRPASRAAARASPREARICTARLHGARLGLAAQHASLDPLAVEPRPAAPRRGGRGRRRRLGVGARNDHREPDVDELHIRLRVAIAVAPLVASAKRSTSSAGSGSTLPAIELERLAPVAHPVRRLGLSALEPRAERLAQRAPRGRFAPRSGPPRSMTVRAVSRRRSDAINPAPRARSLAGTGSAPPRARGRAQPACIGPAPPNGISAYSRGRPRARP